MRVWDKISSLISDQDKTERARSNSSPPPKPMAAAPVTGLDLMPEGEMREAIAAGQLQLLNLDAVRAAMGPQWEKAAPQVHLIAEAILRKTLGSLSTFSRVEDGRYVVVFGTSNEAEARALMRSVAQQIREKLFGVNPLLSSLSISSMVRMIDRNVLGSASSPTDAIRAVFCEASQSEAEVLAGPVTPPTSAAQGTAIAAGRMSTSQLVADVRQGSGHVVDVASAIANSLNDLNKATPLPAPVPQQPPAVQGVDLRGTTDTRGAAPERARQPKPSPSQATPTEAVPPTTTLPKIGELRLLYRPIWTVGKQTINAYRLHLAIEVDGTPMELAEFSLMYDDPKVQQAVHPLVIRRAINSLATMPSDCREMLVVAPISRQFINSENGLRYLVDECQRLSPATRAQLVWELTDTYYGSWSTLAPKVAILRRHCKAVALRLSLDHRDFEGISASGASYVSGNVADHDWPERQTLAEMNRFAEASSKAHVRSIVDGLRTSSLAIAAIGAGVDLACGPVIGEDVPTPHGTYPLSIEELYRRRRSHGAAQT